MELLAELKKQGFTLRVLSDNQLGVMPKEKITPGLREKIRAHKAEIIQALKHQTQPDEYLTKGQDEKNDSQASQDPIFEDSRWCEGYAPPRWVHKEVCAWHLEQADPKCVNCKHLTSRNIETWMDSYLDQAINRLNQLYQANDIICWAHQTNVSQLTQKITEAFLMHNMEGFKKTVNEWEELFKKMIVPQSGKPFFYGKDGKEGEENER